MDEDEEIVLLARRHRLLLVRSILVPLVVLALSAAHTTMFILGKVDWADLEAIVLPLSSLVSLAMLGWIVLAYVEWENDQFIVTNRRVVALRRIYRVSEDKRVANLERIQDVGIKAEGILAYLFDYGDVSISTGSASSVVEFVKVPHPSRVKDVILEQVEALTSSAHEERRSAIREDLGRELGYGG